MAVAVHHPKAKSPVIATWMLAMSGATGARSAIATMPLPVAATTRRSRTARMSAMTAATARTVNATIAAAMWMTACQVGSAAGPSAAPSGKPFAGGLREEAGGDEACPADGDEDRDGGAAEPVGHDPPVTDRQADQSQSDQDEGEDLDPAEVSRGELAEGVDADVESGAREHLHECGQIEQRSRECAREQQRAGRTRECADLPVREAWC